MKILKTAVIPAFVTVLLSLITACGTDSYYETTGTGDCLVTSVQLGTMNRYVTTKNSAGKDTTIASSVSGSYFPMSIDQQNLTIFNVDSLPVGADVKKVVFTTFNMQGYGVIRSLSSDKDTILSLTDSTDLSVPRQITVYSTNGENKRTYTLNVRVHKEFADTFRWNTLATGVSALAALSGQSRLIATDDKLFAFADKDGRQVVLSATKAQPAQWEEHALPADLDCRSVVEFNNRLYAIAGGRIVVADNPSEWSDAGSTFSPSSLVAGSTTLLFALKDGKFYSSADGVAWTEGEDDSHADVPAANVCGAVLPVLGDTLRETALALGTKNDGTSAVWSRDVSKVNEEGDYTWRYLNPVDEAEYRCPALSNPSLAVYDDGMAIIGTTAADTVSYISMSHDNGRTWKSNEVKLPFSTKTAPSLVLMTSDSDNYLWIINGGNVYRGRYNRLGWKDEQVSFERSKRK